MQLKIILVESPNVFIYLFICNYEVNQYYSNDNLKNRSSAYMLVYVRKDFVDQIQLNVTEEDIPLNIRDILLQQKDLERSTLFKVFYFLYFNCLLLLLLLKFLLIHPF
jgi:uncharacterized protein (UPF0128 family)